MAKKPTDNHQAEYDIFAIRQLLCDAFTPEELLRFCEDWSDLKPVVNEFGVNPSLNDMVDDVIRYCDKRLLLGQLLARVNRQNPKQYEAYNTRLGEPSIGTTPIDRIFLSYDWEDRPAVRLLVDSLRKKGAGVIWDQDWPCWEDRAQKLREGIAKADIFALYSSSSAQFSEWVGEEIKLAEACGKRVIMLDRDPDHVRYSVADKDRIPIPGGGKKYPDRAAKTVIESLHLIGTQQVRAAVDAASHPADVTRLLDGALEANLSIPSDAVMDKLFVSPEACASVERAFRMAQRSLDWDSPQRLRATLEYGRLKRFQGEWTEATEKLRLGRDYSRRYSSELYPLFCLELRGIEFERGSPDSLGALEKETSELQSQGVTLELVKILRQFGNMLRDQGNWPLAEEHLTRAMYLAEYLKDESDVVLEPALHVGRSMLWIDCIRERANLFSQQGRADEALSQFEFATEAISREGLSRPGEYLQGLIFYHLGRIHLLYKHDVKQALRLLDESRQILHKYDNPIRLSFVYDALGKAKMLRHPPELADAERYLDKAMRVRKRCRHDSFFAFTELGLADLHWLRGQHEQAMAKYKEARDTFRAVGNTRDLGTAYLKLGTRYAKMGAEEQALECLQKAEDQFTRVGLESGVRDCKFERLKLKHRGELSEVALRTLVNDDPDLRLDEIGEYAFHDWIKEETRRGSMAVPRFNGRYKLDGLIQVPIGGDDAAVLALPGSEDYDLVLNTDAAPGSICRSPELEMGRYAAKFSVVHSLSDVLAMGGRPLAVLLNLYLTRDAKVRYAMTVIETVIEEARNYGAALIGGDMKERREQSVGCVGIGVVKKGQAIQRNGAKPGHVVAITLAKERKIGCRWAQEIIEYMRESESEQYRSLYEKNWKKDLLFLPYREMVAGAETGLIKSAIDTSDGFLACLQLLAHESGVSFQLDENLIEEIIDERVKKIAKNMGLRPAQFLFNAGHDWEIVLTTESQDDYEKLRETIQKAGGDLARLGTVIAPADELADGIALVSSETQRRYWIPFFTDEKFVRRGYEERAMDWDDLRIYLEGARELDL